MNASKYEEQQSSTVRGEMGRFLVEIYNENNTLGLLFYLSSRCIDLGIVHFKMLKNASFIV